MSTRQLLQKVPGNSIWGAAIYWALMSGEPLEPLVEQLRSQYDDNPALMTEILTEPIATALFAPKSLRGWLDAHPLISPYRLAKEAGIPPSSLASVNIPAKHHKKIIAVLVKYGY